MSEAAAQMRTFRRAEPRDRYRAEPLEFEAGGFVRNSAGAATATIPGSVVARAGGRYRFEAGRWDYIGTVDAEPAPEAAA